LFHVEYTDDTVRIPTFYLALLLNRRPIRDCGCVL